MKIAVWGIGNEGRLLLETKLKNVKIDFFIDNNKDVDWDYGVFTPEEAVKREYDVIIVTTGYAKEIYEQAVALGFDMSKFLFIYNNYVFEDMNTNYEAALQIFTPEYVDFIKNRYHVIRGMIIDEIKDPMCVGGEKRKLLSWRVV